VFANKKERAILECTMATILLTGASGGIGSAVSSALKNGTNDVIEITREHADLASFDDIQKLEKKVLDDKDSLDWIVCAHGFIGKQVNLEKQEPEVIDKTFRINVLSLFYITKLFLKYVRPGGGIIFISSTAGIHANGHFPAYSASKAAVNSFTQSLARNRPEYNFFSVCPGPTNTAMRESIAGDSSKMQPPSVIANLIRDIVTNTNKYKSGDIIAVRNSVILKEGGIT